MPVDPFVPPSLNAEERLQARIRELEKTVDSLSRVVVGEFPVVVALPAAGREGRVVKLLGGAVYIDTGTSWAIL